MTDLTTHASIIDTKPLPGAFIGIHVLRTVVGVNLNAGFDGAPKSILHGNARRLRVSSQSMKRAMREWMHSFITADERATRTRKVPGAAAEILAERHGIEKDTALHAIAALLMGAGKFTILAETIHQTREITFTPYRTPELLAELAHDHWDDLRPALTIIAAAHEAALHTATPGKDTAKTRKASETPLPTTELPKALSEAVLHAFAPGATAEIALSGRMLTALPDGGTIEAAGSVAHAYSVDPWRTIRDEWTAADDWNEGSFSDLHAGASNLGETTLASGTLYQWAALDRRQLRDNLSTSSGLTGHALEDAAVDAERLWVSAAAWAVPGAKKHGTGSHVLPTLVVVTASDTPPLTAPIYEDALIDNVTIDASHRLAAYLTRIQRRFPVNAGHVIWLPPAGQTAPEFPAAYTIED